jgi:hypothetical protein
MFEVSDLSESEAALLIYLFVKANHPYAIASDFKKAGFRIRSLWYASKLYPILKKLEERKLVMSKVEVEGGRKKTVYVVNISTISMILGGFLERIDVKHVDFPTPFYADAGLLHLYNFLRMVSPDWSENPVEVLKQFKELNFLSFLSFLHILARDMILLGDFMNVLLGVGENITYIYEGYKGPVEPLIERSGVERLKKFLLDEGLLKEGDEEVESSIEPYISKVKEFIRFWMVEKPRMSMNSIYVLKSKIEEEFMRILIGDLWYRNLLITCKFLKKVQVVEEFQTPEEFEEAVRRSIAEEYSNLMLRRGFEKESMENSTKKPSKPAKKEDKESDTP